MVYGVDGECAIDQHTMSINWTPLFLRLRTDAVEKGGDSDLVVIGRKLSLPHRSRQFEGMK